MLTLTLTLHILQSFKVVSVHIYNVNIIMLKLTTNKFINHTIYT